MADHTGMGMPARVRFRGEITGEIRPQAGHELRAGEAARIDDQRRVRRKGIAHVVAREDLEGPADAAQEVHVVSGPVASSLRTSRPSATSYSMRGVAIIGHVSRRAVSLVSAQISPSLYWTRNVRHMLRIGFGFQTVTATDYASRFRIERDRDESPRGYD